MPTSLTAFGKSIKVLLTSGVALGCPREGVLDSADSFLRALAHAHISRARRSGANWAVLIVAAIVGGLGH